MGLEEDINQTKGFTSERQKALVNIMFTEGWLRGLLSEMLKPFELTGQQYNVLRILRGSEGKALSTSCVRSRMLDKMSDASRIVDRLNKKGLVKRKKCFFDKRLVDVFITDKGLKLLNEIDKTQSDFDNAMQDISEKDAATLNEILDRTRGSFTPKNECN